MFAYAALALRLSTLQRGAGGGGGEAGGGGGEGVRAWLKLHFGTVICLRNF